MSIDTAATIIATFDTRADADRAIAEAVALGLAPMRVGRLENGHAPILVAVAPTETERTTTLAVLQRLAAGPLLDVADARRLHRQIPHPGVDDRGGIKLPFADEYPRRPETPPAPPRQPHAVLDPATRTRSFAEIDGGLTLADAMIEADRCVRCPEPPCRDGCPAGNDIPSFVARVAENDLGGAFKILQRTNSFSAICGRVCDVDRQCEGACVLLANGGEAVQIGRLERLVADAARIAATPISMEAPTGPKVTVVGAGPAGLAAAGDLVDAGCRVEVIEAGQGAGGAVAWGIPDFRLPREVLSREIEQLRQRGVLFHFGRAVGRDRQLEELIASNAAVILAIGTQGSVAMPLPGSDLRGVWQAKDLLTAVKARGANALPVVGPHCVVLGGGNTALDAAQTLMRLRTAGGAPEVTIVYRRGEDEMPARRDEVNSAKSEGVAIRSWATPIAILGAEEGRVRAVRFVGTRAVRPSAGRRSEIVPIPGSDFELEAETVVYALGYRTDLPALPDVKTDRKGLIAADVSHGRTSRQKVWAVGDVVTGPKTVVHAMAAGRRVARDVIRSLRRSS